MTKKMLYLDIFGQELENLKLMPLNLFNCKVWCKIKILKFGDKNA